MLSRLATGAVSRIPDRLTGDGEMGLLTGLVRWGFKVSGYAAGRRDSRSQTAQKSWDGAVRPCVRDSKRG